MQPAEQDAIANMMLGMVKTAEPLDIEPEHLAAVMEGMAQADRGEFVEGEARDLLARSFARVRSPQ